TLSYDYWKSSREMFYDDADATNGIAIDYIHGFSISKTLPIFVETGLGASFGFWGDTNDDVQGVDIKYKFAHINLSVPINFAYKFNINNDFSIHPFAGLNLKFNLYANNSVKLEFDDSELQDFVDDMSDKEFEEQFGSPRDYSMFDKDYVGKDGQWKRFQLGWHIGVGVNYKALYIGLSYGTDFMEICKKHSTSNFKIGVGFNF
ncbi:MAG: outer membrane beta-barrel protein, partial [Muribaculaceae bacterium]|nr:outer membrane beta-barrel protein [Muribaculaceae bacterium]